MTNETPGSVLIVDDQLVPREILQAALEGYRVETAESAVEALTLLEVFSPDVMLLDIELAESSGYDLCRRIREIPKFLRSKIAFVSAHSSVEKRLEGYQAGADDFISKPINCLEVAAKVRVLMRLKAVEEVDQLKRNFLSLISHETMTPLTVIRGYCDVLLSAPDLGAASTVESLNAISESTDRLTELIQKIMLCLNLQESQAIALQPQQIKLIIDRTIECMTSVRGVSVERLVEWQVLPVNQVLLSKAVEYLLHNALRFAPDNSVVRVIGKRSDNFYVIGIEDRGAGISETFLQQVLQPFAVNDIAHHNRGSGLSIYISRRIAELHNGRIAIQNLSQGGCRAELLLGIDSGRTHLKKDYA